MFGRSPFGPGGPRAAGRLPNPLPRNLASAGSAAPFVDEAPPPVAARLLPRPAAAAPRAQIRSPLTVLSEVFGYDSFRGDQAEIVDHVSNGGDAMVLMPTGGGKSLCFQVPALVRGGLTVVISPLIALMRDQVTQLVQVGVRAASIDSDAGAAANARVEREALEGRIDLLYVSPERFTQEGFQSFLRRAPLSLFAIDEAHCVSAWGHSFRKDYLGLGELCARFEGIPRMALTGTADRNTERDMLERLDLKGARVFRASFDRPNIHYTIDRKIEPQRQLLEFLGARRGQSGIVYRLSRKDVEDTAAFLAKNGFDVVPYHAGYDAATKAANQDHFLKGDGVVAVATVAFGMGINKPDVRWVAHLDLPETLEHYYQETGRAGRDGLPAHAWMCYNTGDIVRRREMAEKDDSEELPRRVKREKLQRMVLFAESPECRVATVLRYFGEEHAGGCGRCDRCLNPVATFDGTVDAQKILSAAHRTGERFGELHLIDVVVGDANTKIKKFRHQDLPTFGSGRGHTKEWWRQISGQLVAAGLLDTEPGGHGSLRLTEEGRKLLRSERTIQLVAPTERRHAAGMSGGRSITPAEGLPPERQGLWASLKEMRTELARGQDVPAYVIFNDQTLSDLVAKMPRDEVELARVAGMGRSRVEKYGEHILKVVDRHRAPPALPNSIGVKGFFSR